MFYGIRVYLSNLSGATLYIDMAEAIQLPLSTNWSFYANFDKVCHTIHFFWGHVYVILGRNEQLPTITSLWAADKEVPMATKVIAVWRSEIWSRNPGLSGFKCERGVVVMGLHMITRNRRHDKLYKVAQSLNCAGDPIKQGGSRLKSGRFCLRFPVRIWTLMPPRPQSIQKF